MIVILLSWQCWQMIIHHLDSHIRPLTSRTDDWKINHKFIQTQFFIISISYYLVSQILHSNQFFLWHAGFSNKLWSFLFPFQWLQMFYFERLYKYFLTICFTNLALNVSSLCVLWYIYIVGGALSFSCWLYGMTNNHNIIDTLTQNGQFHQ